MPGCVVLPGVEVCSSPTNNNKNCLQYKTEPQQPSKNYHPLTPYWPQQTTPAATKKKAGQHRYPFRKDSGGRTGRRRESGGKNTNIPATIYHGFCGGDGGWQMVNHFISSTTSRSSKTNGNRYYCSMGMHGTRHRKGMGFAAPVHTHTHTVGRTIPFAAVCYGLVLAFSSIFTERNTYSTQ